MASSPCIVIKATARFSTTHADSAMKDTVVTLKDMATVTMCVCVIADRHVSKTRASRSKNSEHLHRIHGLACDDGKKTIKSPPTRLILHRHEIEHAEQK